MLCYISMEAKKKKKCSKMFYLYMFKKDGRFSFKKHKSKKENTSDSTLKTSGGNERALTPDEP